MRISDWSRRVLFRSRHPPVDPLDQHRQLRRRHHHLAVGRRRPYEPSLFQPLGEQAEALAVPPQYLEEIAAPAAEHEQMAREGIVPQRFLDLPGQAVEALAHVGLAGRQPHPDTARDRDHRWPSARSTCASAVASTGGIKRTRMPSGSSISIRLSPAAAFAPQGSGSAAGASSATSNASSFGGVVKRVTPRSRRQRYTKLRSTSCRRATFVTVTPCPRVSETTRSLISSAPYLPRCHTPDRTCGVMGMGSTSLLELG